MIDIQRRRLYNFIYKRWEEVREMLKTKKYIITTKIHQNKCPIGHLVNSIENQKTGEKFYNCDICQKLYDIGEIDN